MKKVLVSSIFILVLLLLSDSCNDTTLDNKNNTPSQNHTEITDTITSSNDNSISNNNVLDSYITPQASVQDLRGFYYYIPQLSNSDEIVSQAKSYNLKSYISYRSESGDAKDAWDAHIYIAPQPYSKENGGFYEFSSDYIDVFVSRNDRNEPLKMEKAHYYFNQSYYNVEYSVNGNLAGNHIQVCKGLYAVDPTATFSSLEEALENALSLF